MEVDENHSYQHDSLQNPHWRLSSAQEFYEPARPVTDVVLFAVLSHACDSLALDYGPYDSAQKISHLCDVNSIVEEFLIFLPSHLQVLACSELGSKIKRVGFNFADQTRCNDYVYTRNDKKPCSHPSYNTFQCTAQHSWESQKRQD
ncbi:hypothetical protein K435DRAFT_230171 [Dendrothele bispora CBS 962.96]|uniref:Uncharacterized protein n=1 Tax=Dendrothele bispora (strain CBS 962.96) TaxID=1314807 RepID=A0A4S8MM97_DENBC|nr:hypothetical protein K435DRAFT_230171 [Dendrothele bispora CBS 962.96]